MLRDTAAGVVRTSGHTSFRLSKRASLNSGNRALAPDEKQERSLRLLLLYEARSLGRRFARCQLRDCLLYVALEAPRVASLPAF